MFVAVSAGSAGVASQRFLVFERALRGFLAEEHRGQVTVGGG